jgi:hypothetical protein
VPEGGWTGALVVMEPKELVWRARHGAREAERDREFLVWIDRFRYTSVELLATRFGVAAQNVRVRLKRLEAGRLVRLERRRWWSRGSCR